MYNDLLLIKWKKNEQSHSPFNYFLAKVCFLVRFGVGIEIVSLLISKKLHNIKTMEFFDKNKLSFFIQYSLFFWDRVFLTTRLVFGSKLEIDRRFLHISEKFSTLASRVAVFDLLMEDDLLFLIISFSIDFSSREMISKMANTT